MPELRRFSDGPPQIAAFNVLNELDLHMKEQRASNATPKTGKQPAPLRVYRFSPKVIIIAGPPASGKSYAARKLADELGYDFLRLDGFTHKVAEQYGGDIEVVRQPNTYNDFKNIFLPLLRARRYRDIVFEGCRISHPHIHQAFLDALDDIYSPFTIVRPFYLNPPRESASSGSPCAGCAKPRMRSRRANRSRPTPRSARCSNPCWTAMR